MPLRTALPALLQESTQPGSVIRTDGWDGYARLCSVGYVHTVAHKSSSVGDNPLKLAHLVASLLKRWLLGTHQGAVSHEHLEYYLDEFVFRFNRRASTHRGKLFFRLLENAVLIEPVPYRNRVKHVRGRKPQNHNIRMQPERNGYPIKIFCRQRHTTSISTASFQTSFNRTAAYCLP